MSPALEGPNLKVAHNVEACSARPDTINFRCTRAKGHALPHVAHQSGNLVVWVWPAPDWNDREAVELWLAAPTVGTKI